MFYQRFKIHFNPLTLLSFITIIDLIFKFIQLRLFHQLLLYVVVNFLIFKIFFKFIKKIQLIIEKHFTDLYFQKI